MSTEWTRRINICRYFCFNSVKDQYIYLQRISANDVSFMRLDFPSSYTRFCLIFWMNARKPLYFVVAYYSILCVSFCDVLTLSKPTFVNYFCQSCSLLHLLVDALNVISTVYTSSKNVICTHGSMGDPFIF